MLKKKCDLGFSVLELCFKFIVLLDVLDFVVGKFIYCFKRFWIGL